MSELEAFQPERRRSFRCAANVEKDGILRVGDKLFNVQIVDESRDGVGILSPLSPGVRVNDLVEMKTAAGLFQARVAKVRRFGSQFRLGLERMGDLPVDLPKGSPWLSILHNQQSAGEGASKAKVSTFTFGVWMTIGSAAAFAAMYWSLSGLSKKSDRPGAESRETTTFVSNHRSGHSTGSDAPPQITAATPFAVVSAGEYLHLTEVQRLKILQIIAKATASAPEIRRVSVTGSTDGLPPQALSCLNGAMVEILNVLDESQRQRWRGISSGR